MCIPKTCGGLGFKSLHAFNIALLDKQAWRLFTQPDSLVARVFKVRCYPKSSLFGEKIGSNPSYVWRSVWESISLVRGGAGVRVGLGDAVNVLEDPWLPVDMPFVETRGDWLVGKTVAQLMVPGQLEWDLELLRDVFTERDATIISSIPLDHGDSDSWYWRLEKKGFYNVQSAYRHTQIAHIAENVSANFVVWKLLWNLKIPPKVKLFL